MGQRSRLVLTLVCAASVSLFGCGANDETIATETRTSALTTTTSRLVVPAYWGSDSPDWGTLESGSTALPAGSIVIANPDSGPGGWDPTLYQHLANLKARGVIVLGYVNADTGTESSADNDLWIWSWMYGGGAHEFGNPDWPPGVLDGIFFDNTGRDSDYDIGGLMYLAGRVQTNQYIPFASTPGYVMFNLSKVFAEHAYVDCLIQASQAAGDASRGLFLDRETYASTYLGTAEAYDWTASSWDWVNGYRPDHFAHVIHDADPQASTHGVLDDARGRNAAYVYVTDGLMSGDTYGQLASGAVWSDEIGYTNGQFGDFGGSGSDSFALPYQACTGSGAACSHDLCQAGDPVTSNCSPCATAVCNGDPYCCATAWDGICVGEIGTYCDSSYCQ